MPVLYLHLMFSGLLTYFPSVQMRLQYFLGECLPGARPARYF